MLDSRLLDSSRMDGIVELITEGQWHGTGHGALLGCRWRQGARARVARGRVQRVVAELGENATYQVYDVADNQGADGLLQAAVNWFGTFTTLTTTVAKASAKTPTNSPTASSTRWSGRRSPAPSSSAGQRAPRLHAAYGGSILLTVSALGGQPCRSRTRLDRKKSCPPKTYRPSCGSVRCTESYSRRY